MESATATSGTSAAFDRLHHGGQAGDRVLEGIFRGPELSAFPASTLWSALGTEDAPWLTFHTGRTRQDWTRRALRERASGWAGAFRRAGVHRGAHVGVLWPNEVDFVAAFFGAQAAGAVPVPLPWPVTEGAPERQLDALQPVLSRARLSVLATTPAFAAVDWGVRCVTAPAEPVEALAPGDVAFLQFTSGSTGDPRGAVISQRAALASAVGMAQALGLGPGDVGVSWLPFFHDMGLVGVLLTSLVARFPVHVLRPGEFLFRPRRWLELASETKASLLVGPNFAWELATRRVPPEGLDLSAVRCALNGSEPVHRSTLDGFSARFAAAGFRAEAQLPVYGLAEATLGVAFSRPGEARGDLSIDGRQVPSVGALVPGVELCLRDAEGRLVPEGAQGEVCVRGPTVMDGYFEHPEATAQALRDGWLHTGDLGVWRDGALYIVGREKELVIQAGRKFHPADIERVVAGMVDTTPNGVAAVSRPDATQGSEALLVLVELRRLSRPPDPVHIRGELLRVLGVRADRVEFVPAGTLPRTTSGKVKRRAAAARFGVTHG
jgi:acyl-CoA synthetase (AMP-forming)/AMP-acid ligase II